jgi:TIR domain
MPVDKFEFDAFLSYSPADRASVFCVAERLRSDGLTVWFDAWEIKLGDNVPAKIEQGLERSRVLLFFVSANAVRSDWPQLEARTFRFRDPLNENRRFVLLKLDDAPIDGTLAQSLYVNWDGQQQEREYTKLLEVCRPPPAPTDSRRYLDKEAAKRTIQLDTISPVYVYTFSLDGH